MANDSETASRPATLGEAMAEYIQSLKPPQRAVQYGYVDKLVKEIGVSNLSELSGSRVELYAERDVRPTDPNASERVAALKGFFQYLKKKEYTTQNFGVHIRLRRPAGSARTTSSSTAVRVEKAPIEMTADGIEALRRQHEELNAKTSELIQAVEVARSDGDLRENAPYHAAREALAFHESKVKDVEDALNRAVIAEGSHDKTTVGSTVTVTSLDTGKVHKYQLVSAQEANAAASRISVESPVGKELLGRRVGEEISVRTPSGEKLFRVDAVSQS